MARKPKPIEVGHVGCPFHSSPQQARVKKSLVTNKLFIDCPGCGLIMPTLANFQEWIKSNATFNEDFAEMYGDGKQYLGGGQQTPGPVDGASEDEKTRSERVAKTQPKREENDDRDDDDPRTKAQTVKNPVDEEMGF